MAIQVGSRPQSPSYDVRDAGVTFDGVTDDTAAWQRAIVLVQDTPFCDTIVVPYPGPNLASVISATLVVTKPIRIVTAGFRDLSTNPNGGTLLGATLYWAGGAVPMMTVKSATAMQYLSGVEILGLRFHGANAATYGIFASSINRCKFDVECVNVLTGGVSVDDGNGVLSQFNDFPRFKFTYGSTAPVQGAHGLILDGSGGVGVTQNYIGHVEGLVYNGDMVRVGDADNNHFAHVHATVQGGGTGNTVRLQNGGSNNARNNLFDYATGKIECGSGTFGNRFGHLNSEAGAVNIAAGGQVVWDAVDYVTGACWYTPRTPLTESLWLPASAFKPAAAGGATVVDVASLWPGGLAFADAATQVAGLFMPTPRWWLAGALLSIRYFFTMDAANVGASVRIRQRVYCTGALSGLGTATDDRTFTMAVNDAANVGQISTQGFTGNIGYSEGHLLGLRIERLGADGADTALGNLVFLGAWLTYGGYGPNATGVYDQTPAHI